MLIPIGTDNPIRSRPFVNIALIVANVAVFLVLDWYGARLRDGGAALASVKHDLMLWAWSPRWYQFVTSMFLHGDWMHLLGNMVFLWVFGNSLNQKMGHVAYLLYYLGCGIFAGVGYVMLYSTPAVGASGAIFGVAAGFLVLFPLSRVTVLFIFFFIGFLELSGMVLIGFFIAWEALMEFTAIGGADHVAHLAHLSGALFGFGAAMLLLWTRGVGRDQFDLLALLRRWRLRAGYRAHMADPRRQAEAKYGRMARPVESRELGSRPANDLANQRVAELRAEIVAALRAERIGDVAELYESLRAHDPGQALPIDQQRELANRLMRDRHHELAAVAYESLLARYPTGDDAGRIELLLGIIYSRHLANPMRARQHLQRARSRLTDPGDRRLCDEALAHVAEALGET